MKKVIIITMFVVSLLCFSSCSDAAEKSEVCCWNCDEMNSNIANYCSYCGMNLNSIEKVEYDEDYYYENEDDNHYDEQNWDVCFSAGCTNVVGLYGEYCNEHKCAEMNCANERIFSSNYCYFHGCTSLGCKNKRTGLSFYCEEHKCIANGCLSEKAVMSDYCLLHS